MKFRVISILFCILLLGVLFSACGDPAVTTEAPETTPFSATTTAEGTTAAVTTEVPVTTLPETTEAWRNKMNPLPDSEVNKKGDKYRIRVILVDGASAEDLLADFNVPAENVEENAFSNLTFYASLEEAERIAQREDVTGVWYSTSESLSLSEAEWRAKIEDGLYENATEENGKYYVSLRVSGSSCEDFVHTYMADKADVVRAPEGEDENFSFVIRATKEEIETYAKSVKVGAIYAYKREARIEFELLERVGETYVPESEIFPLADNAASADISRAYPVFRADSLTELTALSETIDPLFKGLQATSKIGEALADRDTYNEAFFADNTLLLVYVTAGSSSYSYAIHDAFLDATLLIAVEPSSEGMMNAMMDANFFLLSVKKDSLPADVSVSAEYR